MEENIITMQDIFIFHKKGIGPEGRVIGTFAPTGIRPRFIERIHLAGIVLSPGAFQNTMEVN